MYIQVQHRGLRETSRGDVAAMTFVINLVADLFPEFSYRWYHHTPLDSSLVAIMRGALAPFSALRCPQVEPAPSLKHILPHLPANLPVSLNLCHRLAEEMAPQLAKELDFENEGRNAERAAQFFKGREDILVRRTERP